jgi:hydroxyacyl-ACP dehydratase HTD2-like protein with hotdog domain
MDHFLRHHPGRRVTTFNFRAANPLFDTAPFTLHSAATETGVQLWAATSQDKPIAMHADLEFA